MSDDKRDGETPDVDERVDVSVSDGDAASAAEGAAAAAEEGEHDDGIPPPESESAEAASDDPPGEKKADDAGEDAASAAAEGEGSDPGRGAEAGGGADSADAADEDGAAEADADADPPAEDGGEVGDEFDPMDFLESQIEAVRSELAAVGKARDLAEESLSKTKAQLDAQTQARARLQADFDNFRKRQERELKRLQDERVEKVLLKVLPVYDTFGRAIDQYEKDNSEEALYDGLQRIEKMFMQLLEAQGISPIEAAGKPFDPNLHDAVCRVEVPEDGFDEMVVDVFETGYIFGEKVLKPAKVSVAKE